MELNSNQIKALEMISAEFVDDIRLIREGITGDDLNYMEMVNLIDWDANRQAYIMLDAGNRELYIRNKHPLQLMSQGKTQTGATTAQRIAALEAEIAALKAERDAWKAKYEKLDSQTAGIQTAYLARYSSDESTFEEFCDLLMTLPDQNQREWVKQTWEIDALKTQRDELSNINNTLKAERDNWKHIADGYEASLEEISDTTSLWFCDCTPEEVEIVVAEYAETCEENRELKAIIAAVGYAIETIAGIYLFPTEEIKKVANTLKQYKGK